MFRRIKRSSKDRGFTLIEIMVVVVVLGILAGAVLGAFVGKDEQARAGRAQSDISNMTAAIQLFKLDMRRYPTEAEGLGVLSNAPQSDDGSRWRGPYLQKPVTFDPWGNPFIYTNVSALEFGIECYGADGQPGGVLNDFTKDINSWSNYEDEVDIP